LPDSHVHGVLLFLFDAFRNSFPVDIGETTVVITIGALASKRLSRRRVNVICHRIVPERGKDQQGSYQTPTFVRVLSVNSSQLRLTGFKTPSETTAQTLVRIVEGWLPRLNSPVNRTF
jgi:hypothetical protein